MTHIIIGEKIFSDLKEIKDREGWTWNGLLRRLFESYRSKEKEEKIYKELVNERFNELENRIRDTQKSIADLYNKIEGELK